MKKLVLLVVGFAALVAVVYGATVVASDRWQNHQKQTQAQAVPMVSKKQADFEVASVKTAAAGEYQSLVVKYNGQVAECQKGLVAYGKLTTVQKAQTPAPVCAAPIAQ